MSFCGGIAYEYKRKHGKKGTGAFKSCSVRSIGRERAEEECDVRTVFQRDRDRILHSKAFRRLKDKTQVFLAPQGDHYRNRLTHTLEVSQIARTIAKALRLNEDLVEAIALGHDTRLLVMLEKKLLMRSVRAVLLIINRAPG